MASQNFTNFAMALAKGSINFDTAAFKCLLIDDVAIPSETQLDTWVDRADVTIEHGATGNYTTGGFEVTATLEAVVDVTNNNIECSFAETSSPAFSAATISSKGAIIYYSTGTEADDLLVSFVDFGGTIASTVDNFNVTFDTPLTFNV